MKKMISNLKNEEGSVIIMALIVLVALTMIGIVSTDNTVVELQIVRNETIYRQNFFKAESAGIEGAQVMEDSNLAVAIPWIQTLATAANMEVVSNWNWTPGGNAQLSNNMNDAGDANNNASYAAVFIKKVGSKKMTNPTSLYLYHVYGLFDSTSGLGQSMIRMGYNKRF
jgi:Tfp pilus assembly protein PilX